MGLTIMDGNQAVAWGAYYAGCRFFAGYPLTPATGIYNTMLKLLPPAGGWVIQAEDEIAALGCCIGASVGGAKTMTATSGPGLSLYSEHISLAIASEIPLVIAVVQRLGPSTGAATRGAEGDIQFMRWGNSAGMPVIVLSPENVDECFTLTIRAFDLSERFRIPVFVASSKEIGVMEETVDPNSFQKPPVVKRKKPAEDKPYFPYAPLPGEDIPGFLPLGGETLVRLTSSSHGPDGYITSFPNVIGPMNERLKRKIESAVETFSYADSMIEPNADTLLVTYGITARSARKAYEQSRCEGRPISLLILKTLWPVPEDLILQKASGAKRVIVAEMNLGQYVLEIERILKNKKVDFLGQMNGQLITPEKIMEVVHG